jgi:hypothetical protein
MSGGDGGGAESGVAAEKMAGAGRLGAMGAKALDRFAGCSTATDVAAAEGCWWAVQQAGVSGVTGACLGQSPHVASRCGCGSCACMQDVVLSNSVRRQRIVTARWHDFFIAAPLDVCELQLAELMRLRRECASEKKRACALGSAGMVEV